MNRAAFAFCVGLVLASLGPRNAASQDFPPLPPVGRFPPVQIVLPPVNLGASGIMDALSFDGHLLVLQQISVLYHARKFYSQDDEVPGDNHLSTFLTQTHLIYQPPFSVLGGNVALNALIGFAVLNADTFIPLNVSADVFTDFIIGPILQWPDRRLFGNPFYHRLAVDFVLPTGQYDPKFNINPGSNVFTVNPYYSFTYFFDPARTWEVSLRTHYQWNSENDDPPELRLPPTPFSPSGAVITFDDTQPGQAFHWNFGVSYSPIPPLRIGLNGYYLRQITNDKIEGRSLPDSKEQVLGIGPGLWIRPGNFMIFLSGFYETLAEDRPQGITVILRFLTFVPFGAPPS